MKAKKLVALLLDRLADAERRAARQEMTLRRVHEQRDEAIRSYNKLQEQIENGLVTEAVKKMNEGSLK